MLTLLRVFYGCHLRCSSLRSFLTSGALIPGQACRESPAAHSAAACSRRYAHSVGISATLVIPSITQLPVETASLTLTCVYVAAFLIRWWAAARDGGAAGLGGFRSGFSVVAGLLLENVLTCWGCLVVLSAYQARRTHDGESSMPGRSRRFINQVAL